MSVFSTFFIFHVFVEWTCNSHPQTTFFKICESLSTASNRVPRASKSVDKTQFSWPLLTHFSGFVKVCVFCENVFPPAFCDSKSSVFVIFCHFFGKTFTRPPGNAEHTFGKSVFTLSNGTAPKHTLFCFGTRAAYSLFPNLFTDAFTTAVNGTFFVTSEGSGEGDGAVQ